MLGQPGLVWSFFDDFIRVIASREEPVLLVIFRVIDELFELVAGQGHLLLEGLEDAVLD